jgi:CRISPR-associated protein Cas1
MKKLGNTLYITTQGAYLAKDGTNVVVRVEQKDQFRVPITVVESIVCFGNVSCSPFLMGFCGENRVGISFLTESGRFLARIQGPQSGNILLRRAQFQTASDGSLAFQLAKLFVSAKIINTRRLLQRTARDQLEKEDARIIHQAAEKMLIYLEDLEKTNSLDIVRGIEGIAANAYFSVFNHLILAKEPEFRFSGRNKRPPLDIINALLSFLYVLLAHDAAGACEAVGLDPQMGFLHQDRPGRNSLALDLMEEFRPAVDRMVLSMVNRKQVKSNAFERRESGEIRMNDETRKDILVAYQKRKQEEMLHPFLKEKVPFGLFLHVQAQLLARFLRGDLDNYPPYFSK